MLVKMLFNNIIWFFGIIYSVLAEGFQKAPIPIGNGVKSCNSTSPLNPSKDICGDICDKTAICSADTGACICAKEPTPTTLGGHFMHCTNWKYVEQEQCQKMCQTAQKSACRVCWTFTIGNYCTCFGNSTAFEQS